MLAAAGGGGYGGTDWSTKDVRFMWSVLAGQDPDVHFGVLGGWQKMADLVNEHISRMTRYRAELIAAWPPGGSRASAAYVAQLDHLIDHLRGTLDAATANYQAFSAVTLTLARARIKLHRILASYEANERLNLAWQAHPKPTPAPGVIATARMPVPAARQEQLNDEARTIMYDLSSAILSSRSELRHPARYRSRITTSGTGESEENGPAIPLPGSAEIPAESSAAARPETPAEPGPGGTGPILGGAGSTPAPIPPPGTAPIPPAPGPGSAPAPGSTPAPSPAPAPGVIAPFWPSRQGAGIPAANPPKAAAAGGRGAGAHRAMPSGGVIGMVPGGGMIGQLPGDSPGRPTGPSRPLPFGGVIGQQPIPPGALAGRARPSAHGGDDSRGQERNSWNTPKGVDPIILPPSRPGPIDPGPAIGRTKRGRTKQGRAR